MIFYACIENGELPAGSLPCMEFPRKVTPEMQGFDFSATCAAGPRTAGRFRCLGAWSRAVIWCQGWALRELEHNIRVPVPGHLEVLINILVSRKHIRYASTLFDSTTDSTKSFCHSQSFTVMSCLYAILLFCSGWSITLSYPSW